MYLNKSIKNNYNIDSSNSNSSSHDTNTSDNKYRNTNNKDIKLNNKIKFIDSGIEYLKNVNLKGSLIVIEGPDASGRRDSNRENNSQA